MENLEPAKKIGEWLRKYKYALLILAVGLCLMLLPESKEDTVEEPQIITEQAVELTMEQQLEKILSQVEGAGVVSVLLSEKTGSETIYQTDTKSDTDDTSESLQEDTVLITDSDRNELGLVRRTDPPMYQGAIVVCQGADRADVCLAIVQAVQCVTGLGANQISVVKMK